MDHGTQSPTGISRTGYTFNTISLGRGGLLALREFLSKRVAPHPEIYSGGPVVIDVGGNDDLESLDYEALRAECAACGLCLIGLSGADTEEKVASLRRKGIAVVNSNRYARAREENFRPKVITQTFEVKVPVEVKVPYEVKVPVEVMVSEPPLLINRNVRSGETVRSAGNSVMILGSVANGARVIAAHHIMVFGDLLGEVYAGNPKNDRDRGFTEAMIYAQGLFNPTFVAIAGIYQTADDIDSDPLCRPAGGGNVIASLAGASLIYADARRFIPASHREG